MDTGKSGFLTRVTGMVMTALVFLLPLKFGGLAVMPESGGFYPDDLFSWIFVTFPAHSPGVCGALVLALALCAVRRPNRAVSRTLLLWCVVPTLAALPGLCRGYADESLGEISNLLGIGAFGAAAGLLVAADRAWGRRFAVALFAGGMATAVCGIHQYFFGLDELREFAAERIRNGAEIPVALQNKLQDPRIFATMASSNALTSLMLMLLPLAALFAWEWGAKFAPARVSRPLFAAVFLIPIAANMVFASSRASVLCLVIAAVVAAFSAPRLPGKYRLIAAVAAAAVLACGLFFAARFGRGFGSMAERADYLRTSAILAAEHPLTGAGWGNFFRTHMRIKLTDTDEAARDPHNVVAAFASQAGVLSGIVMLALLLLPLVLLWKHRFSPGLPMAVFWCGVFFTVHSLLDCDWHVPALPTAMTILYCAALAEVSPTEELSPRARTVLDLALAALGVAAFVTNVHSLRGDREMSRIADILNPPKPESAPGFFEAKECFERAKKLRPHSAAIRHLEGDWYARRGQFDLARERYLEAARLDPLRPGAWAALARIADLQGDRKTAAELMDKAHALFPKNKKYTLKNEP